MQEFRREIAVYPTQSQVAAQLARRARSSRTLSTATDLLTLRALEEAMLAARQVRTPIADGRTCATLLVPCLEKYALRADKVGVRSVLLLLERIVESGLDVDELRAARAPERLVAVFDAWQRELAGRGLTHRSSALWQAAIDISGGGQLPGWLAAARVVRVMHWRAFAPCRRALLEALAQRLAPHGEVQVAAPYHSGAAAWFGDTKRLLEQLEGLGDFSALTLLPLELAEMIPTGRLGRGVIGAALGERLDAGPSEGAPGCDSRASHADESRVEGSHVELIAAPSVRAELAAVARRVRAWLDRGIPAPRIAVAVVDGALKRTAVVDALESGGIRVSGHSDGCFGDRMCLSDVAAVRFVLGLLRCAEHSAPQAIIRALAATYAEPWLRSLGVTDAHALRAELYALAYRSASRGGFVALRRACREFTRSSAPLEVVIDACDALTRPVSRAPSVAVFANEVRRVLSALMLCSSANDDASALELARIVRGDVQGDAGPAGAMVMQARARDRRAIDALLGVLDRLEVLHGGVGNAPPTSPGSFLTLLEVACANTELDTSVASGAGVQVLSLDELAGVSVDAAAIVGLYDRADSEAALGGQLLRPNELEALVRALLTETGRRRRAYADIQFRHCEPRHLRLGADAPLHAATLLGALACVEGEVVLSCAHQDDAGNALGPSEWLTRLCGSLHAAGMQVDVRAGDEYVGRPQLRVATRAASFASDIEQRAAIERARSMAARGLADVPVAYSPWCGHIELLQNLELAPLLEGYAIATSPAACSDFDRRAACSFQDFARRILRVQTTWVDYCDDLDPQRFGVLAHEWFESVLGALRREELGVFRAAHQARAVAVAERTLDAQLATLDSAVPRPVVPRLQQLRQRLVTLVSALYARDDGYEIVATERGFGLGTSWSTLHVPAARGYAEVWLQGRLDLLERCGDAWRVSDLKSGSASTLQTRLATEAVGKTEFQLPLYASALRTHPEAATAREVDVRYLSLRSGEPTPSLRELWAKPRRRRKGAGDASTDAASADEVLSIGTPQQPSRLAIAVLKAAHEARQGQFPVHPVDGACDSCGLHAVCRVPADVLPREVD